MEDTRINHISIYQESWMYLLVKSRNSQIFYIINIMNFSKFAQEIYFYLLIASLDLIRKKLKSLIHSFISCPNEWFQVEFFSRKYNEKLHFRILLFLLAIVLRCWNPVEYIQKIIISFLTVPLDEIDYGVRHIKLFKIQNHPFAGVLQDRFFKKFAKFTEIHLCRSLFYNKVANELW